ncbi:MAG: zeta toxin family protein [Candidatus Thioglobus sp.]|nr:zeta toxin family protein [Candidatus Thioglobus pontius]MBL6985071.1 zeta toxin family protein [Candidatus Thioglobus sp.]
MNNPTFTIIAGVNGSGKTTFALDYIKDRVFINADLIATGLSPNNPDLSQFVAGKLMLKKINECIESRENFAIETTLASKNYLKVIDKLKKDNWNIEMLYLYLPSVELSIQRVAERVKNGGHNIKLEDISRRYKRSMSHLINEYFQVIDKITCFDNESDSDIVFFKNDGKVTIGNQKIYDDILRYKK